MWYNWGRMKDTKQYVLRSLSGIIWGCMRDMEQYMLRYLCGIRGDG